MQRGYRLDGSRFHGEHEPFKGGVKLAYEEVEGSHLRGKAPWLSIIRHRVMERGERRDCRVVEIIAIKKLWTDVEPVDM